MDLHCSLDSEPSATDPVTNWTLISGVELDTDLAGMLQAGQYPRKYFPAFIHELVHHWCFHTPVGLSLAMLQLRARRRALLLAAREAEEDTDEFSVAEDAVRYESAISLMRPLAEGLALFAEYDSVPGDSSVISTPMLMTTVSFTKSIESEAKDVAFPPSCQVLKQFLRENRSSDAFLERKVNLLMQPFTSAGGGYLVGYMSVKNIWNNLRGKTNKLWDADLFMAYLKAFFYDDHAFLATLLDPNTMIMSRGAGDRDCVDNISRYFQRRLDELISITTDTTVGEFERWVLEKSHDGSSTFHLGRDQEAAERGRSLKDQLLAELLFEGPPDTLSKKLRRSDHWTLAQRSVMCVGSFSAPVEVNKFGRVHVWRNKGKTEDQRFPVVNLQGIEGVMPQKGDGSLEYFFSASGRYSFVAVTLNERVVATWSASENVTPDFMKEIGKFRTSLRSSVKERELWHDIVDRVFAGHPGEDYREHYRGNIQRVAECFYVDKALAYTKETLVEQCASMMHQKGVYEVLASDYDAINDLARISLASAINESRAFIAKAFEVNGRSLDVALAKINECESQHGLKLLLTFQIPGTPHHSVIYSLV